MAATAIAPPPLQRPRMLLVGTAFAAVAAAMVILGMLGIYLTERATVVAAGGTWLPEGVVIALNQPNMMFGTLLLGCITVQWAVSAVRNDDRVNSYLALGLTLLFGFAYLNMLVYLWSQAGLDVDANIQSVLIYGITGAHFVMALVAMLFVGLMAFRALAGGYDARQYDGIAASALFWHVMVAVYAVIWLAIYVTK